jgi:hypothetical protein
MARNMRALVQSHAIDCIAFIEEQIASCRRQMAVEPHLQPTFAAIIAKYERDLAGLKARCIANSQAAA